MTIDADTGVVTWVPTADQVDQTFDVRIYATETSTAELYSTPHDFRVRVFAQPGNNPPVIITEPETEIIIPDLTVGAPQGDVSPDRLNVALGAGEQTTETVTITIPPDTYSADIVFVVDESGSMSGEHTWLGTMIPKLDAVLGAQGITNNQYALVGFGSMNYTAGRLFSSLDSTDSSDKFEVALYGPDDALLGTYQVPIFGTTAILGNVTLAGPGQYLAVVQDKDGVATAQYRFLVEEVAETVLSAPLVLNEPNWHRFNSLGERNEYTFTLGAETRVYFDALTGQSDVFWTLTGPDGTLVDRRRFDQSDAYGISDAEAVIELAAGSYTLTVDTTANALETYGFRLVDLATDGGSVTLPTVLTEKLTTSGTLDPEMKTDVYRFTVGASQAGDIYTFTITPPMGGNWRMVDPYGNVGFGSGSGTSSNSGGTEDLTLYEGTYTLLMEGTNSPSYPDDYSFEITYKTDGPLPSYSGTSLTLNATTSGSIDAWTEVESFSFSLASETYVAFDALTSDYDLNWTLVGPHGPLATDRLFTETDGSGATAGDVVLRLPAGTYRLDVDAQILRDDGTVGPPSYSDPNFVDPPGAYQFRLLDLATAAVSLDLATDVPKQEMLDPANQTDVYSFAPSSSGEYYFDAVAWSGWSGARWRLVDAGGKVLFSDALSTDQAHVELTAGKTYRLLIEGDLSDTSSAPSYTFNINPHVVQTAPLTLGTAVNSSLGAPGETDVHTFSGTFGQFVYFDSLGAAAANHTVRLESPSGKELFAVTLDGSGGAPDIGPLRLRESGTYRLIVEAAAGSTGNYDFRLFALPAGQTITPGTAVTDTLDLAKGTKVYRFDVPAAGANQFSFNAPDGWSGPTTRWKLIDPWGTVLFDDNFATDQAALTLRDGTYTLLVEGDVQNSTTAQYTFNVEPQGTQTIAPPSGTTLTLGQATTGTITSGDPEDSWLFTGAAGQRVYFDAQDLAPDTATAMNLRVRLLGPGGNVLLDTHVTSGSDPAAPLTLFDAGTYQLLISNDGGGTGTYSFQLLDMGGQPALTLAQETGGSFSPQSESDVWQFTGQAGQRLAVRMDAWGTAAEAAGATGRLVVDGDTEDGYSGIDTAVSSLRFRPGSARHVILVTDEDRDVVNSALSDQSTLGVLNALGARLHSIVGVQIDVGTEMNVLGLDGPAAEDNAYKVNPDDTSEPPKYYTSFPIGTNTVTYTDFGGSTTKKNYIDLTFATEASVWALSHLSSGVQTTIDGFTNAFVDIVTAGIQDDLDVTLQLTDATVEYVITNKAANERTFTFDVTFTGDGTAHSFDLQFVGAHDSGLLYGSIPATIWTGYRYDVDAIDPDDDPVSYRLIGETHGAEFDPVTGLLKWAPTTAGQYDFLVEASDGRGGYDTQPWTVTVTTTTADNTKPDLVNPGTLTFQADRTHRVVLSAKDPQNEPLWFQLVHDPAAGTPVPDGLKLDALTGELTWKATPEQITTHTIKVRVYDARGLHDEEIFEISVVPTLGNTNPRITNADQIPTGAILGEEYTFTPAVVDDENDDLTYDLPVAPIGMSIDPETGTIVWTPADHQVHRTFDVILRVRDGAGGVTLERFQVKVDPVNLPPKFLTTPPPGPAVVGTLYEYFVKAYDPNGDTVTLRLDPDLNPDAVAKGIQFDDATGRLYWTPQSGHEDLTHTIVITAEDGRPSGVRTQTIALEVRLAAANTAPVIDSPAKDSTTGLRTLPGAPGVGLTYETQIEAHDAESDKLTFFLEGAPAGMSIDADTGVLTWTGSPATRSAPTSSWSGSATPAGCGRRWRTAGSR